MEEHHGSRDHSRHSRSVVFPRIERNSPEKLNHRDDATTTEANQPGNQRRSPKYGENTGALLARLESMERGLQEEKRSRLLLEDNLRSLLINVQRLSKDLAWLQQQVRCDEGAVQSQTSAMKNMEIHQMAGIGDLWNRLTLGDLNSIKLAGDLNKVAGDMSDFKRSEENLRRRLNSLQNAVDGTITKVEKVNLDFEKNMQVVKVKLETQYQTMEEKIKIIQEKINDIDKPTNNKERDGAEHLSKLMENIQDRMENSLEIHKTWQCSLEERVKKMEEKLNELSDKRNRKEDALVRRVQEVSDKQYSAFKKSQEKQNNYREAFKAVYESITTMQTVLETKLKVTEADLKASINSIMRTLANS